MINFNSSILDNKIQQFINKNSNTDVSKLVLKGIPFPANITKDIIIQIEAKKRCKKKLPTWFNTQNIYYPTKLNIEQTSSEITAQYKANLVSGNSLIDLTGGFGVDVFYFSKTIKQVTHCEINETLSKIVTHNVKQLKVNTINCLANDGIKILKQLDQVFNWIYIDPSRRDDNKEKVFLLKDCLPNTTKFLGLFFKYSKNVMIKTSPLLDISSGINELKHVKTIHCIAVNNEVKELLWVLERDFNGDIEIKTANLKKATQQNFNFILKEESNKEAGYSQPLTYLYEPNAAILKSGAFNSAANKLNVAKLHKHSHLYTSDKLITFPGRVFKIEKNIEYNKKMFKKEFTLKNANVTIRNFPETVAQVRKKFKISDGGNNYLFFTTNLNNSKVILSCTKID